MPELTCTLCGRVDKVEKWHPTVAHDPEGTHAAGYVCEPCRNRVRAEAIRQHDPDAPPGEA